MDEEIPTAEDLAYNQVELLEKLSIPDSRYVSKDISTSFLKEDESAVVRSSLCMILCLDAKGFTMAAQMIKDLIGGFAVVTKGMGNQAALIAKQAYWYWNIREKEEGKLNLLDYFDRMAGYFK